MKNFLLLQSIQAVSSLIGFLFAWWMLRASRFVLKPSKSEYLIFSLNQQKTAIHKASRFNWVIGALYAMLSYWGLPVLVRRYGIKICMALLIAPHLLPSIVIYLPQILYGSLFFDAQSVGEKFAFVQIPMFSKFVLTPIFTGLVGVYLASKDSTYRKNHLSRNGWVVLGEVEATTSKQAIHAAKEW